MNDKAFTLIESLFALSIFIMIIFFMAPVFHIVLHNGKSDDAKLQGMEWSVFCSQLKKEIRQSIRADINSGQLIVTKDSETVQYDRYGNTLRRQVNSLGHEIVLQNVSQYTFSILNNGVKLTVKDQWGKEYSVSAHSFIDWNVEK
ncbi:ComGF family competence protein [Bacillus sp. BRMEA1]|nr:ComGF family competence protein [Neobacillus endophyticus]